MNKGFLNIWYCFTSSSESCLITVEFIHDPLALLALQTADDVFNFNQLHWQTTRCNYHKFLKCVVFPLLTWQISIKEFSWTEEEKSVCKKIWKELEDTLGCNTIIHKHNYISILTHILTNPKPLYIYIFQFSLLLNVDSNLSNCS